MRSLIVENACVGAGTVLDAETARISMLSGAKYIVRAKQVIQKAENFRQNAKS